MYGNYPYRRRRFPVIPMLMATFTGLVALKTLPPVIDKAFNGAAQEEFCRKYITQLNHMINKHIKPEVNADFDGKGKVILGGTFEVQSGDYPGWFGKGHCHSSVTQTMTFQNTTPSTVQVPTAD